MYIYLVPMIGLGSDQVEQATVIKHNLEPYQVDEHKKEGARLLMSRLDNPMKEETKPQSNCS